MDLMQWLRLTQRPVQDRIYEYCDKLGLMTQSDLPLFGCMRRKKLCEGVRHAEEMECLVRKHPCNVVVSYINKPFPNANNEPHRHLNREELENFFSMCDIAVHMQNPDRVIKHVGLSIMWMESLLVKRILISLPKSAEVSMLPMQKWWW